MMDRTGVGLAVVLVCATATHALADELPFEIQNARKAGISDRVQTTADGTAVWNYTARVVVAGSGGDKDAKDLAVALETLEGERGARSTQTGATIRGQLGKLVPGQSLELAVTATFPRVGDYHGELLLYQGTVQRVVPVAIKVEDPSVPEPALVEHGHAIVALDEAWDGSASTGVQIELRNSSMYELKLDAPRIVSARRVDKVDKPTRESQIAVASVTRTKPRAIGAIQGGDVKPVPLDLDGIDEPGVYQVEVQVPVAGHTPKAVDVTVYRRKHWSRALFWIALGVVIAYGVRRFVQGGKERMKVRRALADIRPRLAAIRDEARDPAQVAAAMVLGAEIEQCAREVQWQGDGAALSSAAGRLVARVYLLGEIVAASRTVVRLDADAQAEPRKVLDEALVAVRVDPAGGVADIDAQRRKVAGLGVDDAWRAKLRAALAELQRSSDALVRAGSASLRDAVNDQLRPGLTRAADALSGNRLPQCATLLEEVGATFLAIAVADLRARMQEVPLGTTASAWQDVVSAMNAQLDVAIAPGDWSARRDAFFVAQRAYFNSAIMALVAYATARAADTEHPASNPARLTEIAAELGAELQAGAAGIDRAAQNYTDRLGEVEAAARPRGGATRAAAGDRAALAPWIGVPDDLGAPGTVTTPPEVRLIDAKLRYTDWLVTAAVLGVALASGVKALWLNNLAWGVEGDALTAFLWGAGVGAVGDAFTGLVGLREKLGSAP